MITVGIAIMNVNGALKARTSSPAAVMHAEHWSHTHEPPPPRARTGIWKEGK